MTAPMSLLKTVVPLFTSALRLLPAFHMQTLGDKLKQYFFLLPVIQKQAVSSNVFFCDLTDVCFCPERQFPAVKPMFK